MRYVGLLFGVLMLGIKNVAMYKNFPSDKKESREEIKAGKFLSGKIAKGNLLIKKHKKRCSKQYKGF